MRTRIFRNLSIFGFYPITCILCLSSSSILKRSKGLD